MNNKENDCIEIFFVEQENDDLEKLADDVVDEAFALSHLEAAFTLDEFLVGEL